MLNLKKIAERDKLKTKEFLWIELRASDIPAKIIKKAKKIDGNKYNENCFGVCLLHDILKSQFYVCGESPGKQLFYVDNSGNKHWFSYRLNELEKYIMISDCLKEIVQNRF